jgi:hypothetical protein
MLATLRGLEYLAKHEGTGIDAQQITGDIVCQTGPFSPGGTPDFFVNFDFCVR